MVYKATRNSYNLSTIVQGSSRSAAESTYRGPATLEDYLSTLRNIEKRNGEIYYVRDGPNGIKIFGIEGSAVLFNVPNWLYQAVETEVPSVKYGRRMPVNVMMRKYRKIKRQERKRKQQHF